MYAYRHAYMYVLCKHTRMFYACFIVCYVCVCVCFSAADLVQSGNITLLFVCFLFFFIGRGIAQTGMGYFDLKSFGIIFFIGRGRAQTGMSYFDFKNFAIIPSVSMYHCFFYEFGSI